MAKAMFRANWRVQGIPGVDANATPGDVAIEVTVAASAAVQQLVTDGALTPLDEAAPADPAFVPEKPIDKMNKLELIAFAAEGFGVTLDESLTKAQMLGAIDEAIKAAEAQAEADAKAAEGAGA